MDCIKYFRIKYKSKRFLIISIKDKNLSWYSCKLQGLFIIYISDYYNIHFKLRLLHKLITKI